MTAKVEEKTILHFIFVHNDKAILNQYFREAYLPKAKLSFCLDNNKGPIDELESDIEDKINKINIDTNKSNDIKYDIELDENNVYYYEKIRLYPTVNYKISNISLEYQIYKDKINNIYIDELNDQKKSSISLEIIYYSKNENLLPKKIIYKKKELTCFDSFNNKSRRRIAFLNVDPEQFDFIEDIKRIYPDFKFINDFTYQILVRIAENGEKNYTISKNELKDIGLKKKLKVKINKNQLVGTLKEFKTKFTKSFVETQFDTFNDVENKINEFSEEYETLLNEKEYYDKIFEYSVFDNDDIEIFILMFYLNEFLIIKDMYSTKDKKLEIIETLDSLSNYNNDYENFIPKLKESDIDTRDKLLLIKAYNKKFLDSYRSGYKINYITVINIAKENKLNPYIKALDFIKNIISDLKEESILFEAFLNLDSDTITDLLVGLKPRKEEFTGVYGDEKTVEHGENPTEYGINMMNIDEVKEHLLNLIPKYIIRIDTRMKFKADFDPNSKIMTLNERQLFNYPSLSLNKTFQRENISYKYILPISMEILHEIFGQGKKRLIDNYISDNRNVIRWLKTIHHPFEHTKEILKTSLWVDKDFNNLEKIIGNYMVDDKRYETNNSKYSLYFNDNDMMDLDEDDGCGFHLFDHKY